MTTLCLVVRRVARRNALCALIRSLYALCVRLFICCGGEVARCHLPVHLESLTHGGNMSARLLLLGSIVLCFGAEATFTMSPLALGTAAMMAAVLPLRRVFRTTPPRPE